MKSTFTSLAIGHLCFVLTAAAPPPGLPVLPVKGLYARALVPWSLPLCHPTAHQPNTGMSTIALKHHSPHPLSPAQVCSAQVCANSAGSQLPNQREILFAHKNQQEVLLTHTSDLILPHVFEHGFLPTSLSSGPLLLRAVKEGGAGQQIMQ